MRTFAAILVTALAVGIAAVPAPAEDAKALLKKVDETTYYPQDHGLKDLSASLVLTGGPRVSGMNIIAYWKAPDKKRCVVELPEALKNMPAAMRGNLEKQAESYNSLVDALVPTRKLETLDLYDYTVEKDGDLTKITGKLKEGVKKPNMPEETILWLDAAPTVVKMTTVSKGIKSEMTKITYEKKGDKLLMSSMEMATHSPQMAAAGMAPGKMAMKMEYKEIDSIWLLSALKMEGGMMKGMGYLIKDHAVNKGVDDAVFVVPAK